MKTTIAIEKNNAITLKSFGYGQQDYNGALERMINLANLGILLQDYGPDDANDMVDQLHQATFLKGAYGFSRDGALRFLGWLSDHGVNEQLSAEKLLDTANKLITKHLAIGHVNVTYKMNGEKFRFDFIENYDYINLKREVIEKNLQERFGEEFTKLDDEARDLQIQEVIDCHEYPEEIAY